LGGTLLGFGNDLLLGDAISIRIDIGSRIGDLPRGPEPGPEMPKKKRPQIY
jgi:hypothetical protein